MLKTVQAATGGAVGGNVTITGGTIDNTVIGGTTAANGTFTNVWVGSNATIVSGSQSPSYAVWRLYGRHSNWLHISSNNVVKA